MGEDTMSDEHSLPRTPDEVATFMEDLTFGPPPARDQEADLLASMPPVGSDVMVVRSLRLPIEVDEAVATAAQAAGVPKTAWIRQAIEIVLALQAEEDQPISRTEALRALTLLRPVRRVA
jgi:predicted DNA-binding protein